MPDSNEQPNAPPKFITPPIMTIVMGITETGEIGALVKNTDINSVALTKMIAAALLNIANTIIGNIPDENSARIAQPSEADMRKLGR